MNGTGGISGFWVIGLEQGKPQSWSLPDLARAMKAALKPGEYFAKGFIPVMENGRLLVWSPIYRAGDANCCASGGAMIAELSARPEALELEGVTRRAEGPRW